MNALSVVDAIVTNLSAASAIGVGRVSKNYSVIETSQEPTAVVGWLGTRSVPSGFSNLRDRFWTFSVEVFIKDTGSASTAMDHFPVLTQKILSSLESDPTLQGTVDQIEEIRCARELGEAFLTGTVTLFPFVVQLDVFDL